MQSIYREDASKQAKNPIALLSPSSSHTHSISVTQREFATSNFIYDYVVGHELNDGYCFANRWVLLVLQHQHNTNIYSFYVSRHVLTEWAI